jgi:hypothetical protein
MNLDLEILTADYRPVSCNHDSWAGECNLKKDVACNFFPQSSGNFHRRPEQIRNNKSELIGEINTVVRPGEGVIISSTVYSGEHVPCGGPSVGRNEQGNVHTETVYGGKIGPRLLFAQGEWATVRDGSE